jgi:hypothetical protein
VPIHAGEVGARQPDRHHVGPPVLVVHAAERPRGGLLAPEALHHPHAGERLLQVREHVGDLLAGPPVGPRRQDAEGGRGDGEDREDREGQERQLGVEGEQDDHDADEGEPVHHERREAVRDELADRLDVAGEAAHGPSGGGALVVAELQPHQVPEGRRAKVEQHPLADPAREVGLEVARGPADRAGGHEEAHGDEEHRAVLRANAVVDRHLGERRPGQPGGGDDEHEDHREGRPPGVGPEERQQLAELVARDARRRGLPRGGRPRPVPAGRGPAWRAHASPATSWGRARPPSWMSR